MASELTRLAQKIAIQLHLVAKSCTICNYDSRRSVRKLLDTPSYAFLTVTVLFCSVLLRYVMLCSRFFLGKCVIRTNDCPFLRLLSPSASTLFPGK
jgi:hypothetical protein